MKGISKGISLALFAALMVATSANPAEARMATYETSCRMVPDAYVIVGGVSWVYPGFLDCQTIYSGGGSDPSYLDRDWFIGGGGPANRSVLRGQTIDAASTCDTNEEIRLARANVLAAAFKQSARKGDRVRVQLFDGNTEDWAYICGGSLCAGTIIAPSPVRSDCEG